MKDSLDILILIKVDLASCTKDFEFSLVLSCLFYFFFFLDNSTSLVAQTVKRLHAVRETWVRSLGYKIPWRRKGQSISVFLPGEFHGRRSLKGYSPRGIKESNTTEQLHFS